MHKYQLPGPVFLFEWLADLAFWHPEQQNGAVFTSILLKANALTTFKTTGVHFSGYLEKISQTYLHVSLLLYFF